MRSPLIPLTAALCLATAPVTGQVVVPCAGLIDVTMISEPWETYSRSYAEGAIRLFEAYLDPNMAAGAVIGILHPAPGDPHPVRACSAVIHADPDRPYFAEALVAGTVAAYDPARGLTLRVPVRFPDDRPGAPAIEITINQATGQVSAR